MRRTHFGFALALGVCLLVPASRSQAQVGAGGINVGDPFSLYFGFYLPHQAAVAAQSTPLDTINAAQARQQAMAARDRPGLYDPLAPLGEEELDPTRPYARRAERIGRPHTFPTSTANNRTRGIAPPVYYNRTARYYPTLRAGVGPNSNLAVTRRGAPYFGGR